MRESLRLERETSVGRQAGCASAIGIVLATISIAMVVLMRGGKAPTGENAWLVYAVGGGFGLFGLLMLVLGTKMFLMTRIPETIVEVDKMPVHAGESFQLTIRQPGPIRLKSLRVNLVCEQITTRKVQRAGETKTKTDRRIIHQINVLDLKEASAGRGEQVIAHATVNVPADVRLADIEGRKEIAWRLAGC
jgi:hypothetical protein